VLKVRNFKDCEQNIETNWQETSLILPKKAFIWELIINEILFNPPTNGVDFVELYNASEKFIDLRGWKISNSDRTKMYAITTDFFILPPKTYIVLTTNKEILQKQYPKLQTAWTLETTLPSLNDENGTFVLYSPQNQSDSLYYEEKMHFALISNTEGVSLERIKPEKATNEPQNWYSAASPNFGTPTFKNSQSIDKQAVSSNCIHFSELVITPDGDGFQDFTLLSFSCLGNGKSLNIRVFDEQGREVRHLLKNALVGNHQQIRWEGTDENGRKVGVGYYIFWIESYDLDGNREEIQKKIVVGAKF